jgi:outer membrane protein
MQALMEKEAVTMSESQRRERESELARLSRDLQRVQREVREDANVRRNEELSVIVQRAQEVIKQIAEAEKFDLILQEAVYRSPRIDITDKVIKALADK